MSRWLLAALEAAGPISGEAKSTFPPKAKTPITPKTQSKGDLEKPDSNPDGVSDSFGGFGGRADADLQSPESTPSRHDYPPGAIVHLSRHRPKLNGDGRPVRVLPTHPATCAICGKADWQVGMTDMQGRTLHVRCWKAEGGMS